MRSITRWCIVFIEENFKKAMAVGEVDNEMVKVVPWNGQADY